MLENNERNSEIVFQLEENEVVVTEYDPDFKPRLRFVEAHPVETEEGLGYVITDPMNLAVSSITISEAALFVLSKFDGTNRLEDVRDDFFNQYNQPLSTKALADMVGGLESGRFLAGEKFDRYYDSLVDAYRRAPVREMRSAAELDLLNDPQEVIADLLRAVPDQESIYEKIVGVIAPHLDYPRGRECYSVAYAPLVNRPVPRRVVILGANHFGRGSSVVATDKPFKTPLGVTKADTAFIERLEAQCGDMREYEYDHEREHSVELQLLICQHIWGPEAFELVPILCPDPCGPTGTEPWDGNGVDLRDFGKCLRGCLEDDFEDTLIIAGADLSHIGAQFGDERIIDDSFRVEVEKSDRKVLEFVAGNDAESFLRHVRDMENATRICSVGGIYAAMSALEDTSVKVLRYHQAIDDKGQVGVTCAAAVFVV